MYMEHISDCILENTIVSVDTRGQGVLTNKKKPLTDLDDCMNYCNKEYGKIIFFYYSAVWNPDSVNCKIVNNLGLFNDLVTTIS